MNNIQLAEEKVLRDPLDGYVHINDAVVWDALNTREVQRLRRIHQLGSTVMVYHTGEHSRLGHSLGTYEIVRRMISEVSDIRDTLSEDEKIIVMLAGLLHDIGHAPFSHSFEHITSTSHEEYTYQLLTQPSEIHDVLAKCDPALPGQVAAVINGTYPNPLLHQMISSQLDADRMDYLRRDSYYTGTSYGEFDLERILRTLRVRQDKLVVKASGMHTVEDYIMARYHMYWQVYYHPMARSYEALLHLLFKRLKALYEYDNNWADALPMFAPLLTQPRLSNDDLYHLDEAACQYGFAQMRKLPDAVLADLAGRLLDRHLFECESPEYRQEVLMAVCRAGYDPDYYLYQDEQQQEPYRPYKGERDTRIWVLMENDNIYELSTVSNIVAALTSSADQQDAKLFFPKGVYQRDS